METEIDYWIKSQNYEIVEEPVINADVPVPYLTNGIPAFYIQSIVHIIMHLFQ